MVLPDYCRWHVKKELLIFSCTWLWHYVNTCSSTCKFCTILQPQTYNSSLLCQSFLCNSFNQHLNLASLAQKDKSIYGVVRMPRCRLLIIMILYQLEHLYLTNFNHPHDTSPLKIIVLMTANHSSFPLCQYNPIPAVILMSWMLNHADPPLPYLPGIITSINVLSKPL